MLKIKLNDGQKVFFTSDPHAFHSNLVRGVTKWRDEKGNVPLDRVRDFDTVYQMNEKIVTNINNTVGENDYLFSLGDWSFGGIENIEIFRNQLICKNIYNIIGNHDQHIDRKDGIKSVFSGVYDLLHLEVKDRIVYNFILCHYPMASWMGLRKGYIHLAGHTHLRKNVVGPGKYMDVGLDGNKNFKPYEMYEILNIMGKQPIDCLFKVKVDHHLELIS